MGDETNDAIITDGERSPVMVLDVRADQSSLTLAQLTERVARSNTLVLSQLHAVQQKRFQDEEARGVRLEAKANGLISVNGLTLTLVSSIGMGVLLDKGATLGAWLILVIPVYLMSVWLAIKTGVLALEAVKVKDHHKLGDDDIFPDDVLTQADTFAATPEEDAKTDDGKEGAAKKPEKDREKEGLALYHRYNIVCLSKVLKKDAVVNDEKAARLEKAQREFQRFLFTVGALAAIAALIAVVRALVA